MGFRSWNRFNSGQSRTLLLYQYTERESVVFDNSGATGFDVIRIPVLHVAVREAALSTRDQQLPTTATTPFRLRPEALASPILS